MFNNLNRSFTAFIAIIISIENFGLCFQRSVFQELFSRNDHQIFPSNTLSDYKIEYNLEIEEILGRNSQNEYHNQMQTDGVDNEIFTDMEGCLELGTTSPYMNLSEYPGELCNRVCKEGEIRVCYFEFNLEYYQAMGIACGRCDKGVNEDCNNPQCVLGDGWDKGVMSINRQVPGPAIQVCKNDIIVVDVRNHAEGTAAALHWHGVHMIDTPYMDGVPFVTQCPIPFSNTFRYKFRASEPGTQFYHSHAGHHKVNGQYGALIIRQPQNQESFDVLYDYDLPEHHIFVTDWMHVMAEQYYPGLDRPEGIFADSLVINGRGVYTDPQTQESTSVPPTVFYVTPGKRFRFRFINAMNHACPVKLQIEKHNMKIIASDSFTVFPQTFDSLISNSGERYDFILVANHTKGDFWLRARGYGTCAELPIESYALIRYNTNESINSNDELQLPPFPNYNETYPDGTILNHPNATCWSGNGSTCITELSAFEDNEELATATPDYKFFLGFDNHEVPNDEIFNSGRYEHFANLASNLTAVGAINNLSLVFPDYPLLTQPELIDETKFCDSFNIPARCAGQRLCHCIHRLKVKLNSIVELIIVDETESRNPINHPFHLHGYRFMVMGIGQHPHGVPLTVRLAEDLESKSMLVRDLLNLSPPFKDTVSIPSRGYVILRLRAKNPGFWLMHCHYEWHLTIGMGLVLQVGETSEMVKPPSDFPKCSNYVQRLRSSDL